METMNIWDGVCTTDAKYVKGFSRGGGFKGTAINATWLAREATRTFGPCGIGWGVKVIDEKYVDGHDMGDGQRSIIHVVRVELWYEHDGKRGSIEQYGQTTMVGKNKNGAFTDEEAPKKSITDAMSKCLSLLGFGADIHLGLFDDNKYVADRQREAGKSDKEPVSAEALSVARDNLSRCESKDELRETFKGFPENIREAVKDYATELAGRFEEAA